MTVVLIGKAPNGNLLVTDAMVTMKDNSTSYKECRLKDKIARLNSAKSYCTLLGDENVLYGIQILDDWHFQKKLKIDFTQKETMQNALTAAEKFVDLFNQQAHKQPSTDGAHVFFINAENIYEYKIKRKDNKYSIDTFRFFNDNEVLINYGGHEEKINLFNHSNEQLFNKSTEFIQSFHEKRKKLSITVDKRMHLNYDFDNRFCGVVYPLDENEEQVIIPFHKLSEAIAASANDYKLIWDLIESKEFEWSPKLA